MKIKEIVKTIAEKEALKKQVSVGNVREIVSIISDMIFQGSDAFDALFNNGKRRSKIKANKS